MFFFNFFSSIDNGCFAGALVEEVVVYTKVLMFFLTMNVLQDHYYCPDGWHISEIGDEVFKEILKHLKIF